MECALLKGRASVLVISPGLTAAGSGAATELPGLRRRVAPQTLGLRVATETEYAVAMVSAIPIPGCALVSVASRGLRVSWVSLDMVCTDRSDMSRPSLCRLLSK